MKHPKIRSLVAALAASALVALAATGTASAATLEKAGTIQTQSLKLTMSLKTGTSTVIKDTFAFNHGTCLSSHLTTATESPFTGATVGGPVNEAGFSFCGHPISFVKNGRFNVEHISGTTNGRVYWDLELRMYSTFFAEYLNCKPGTGVPIGTLTGVSSSAAHAELDVNAVLTCSFSGGSFTTKWTANYMVTSPTGLGVTA